MPQKTLNEQKPESKSFENINGTLMLRSLNDFGKDLEKALTELKVGSYALSAVDHSKI